MQELERHLSPPPARASSRRPSVAIVGAGRVGWLMTAGLTGAGLTVRGPLRRGQPADDAGAVLLCVPDAAIAAAAAVIAPGPLVGHCSGATGLAVLAGHEAFSLHPLMTITAGADPSVLAGAGAAVEGSTARALAVATELAQALGLHPIAVAYADRAAYHAAASIASNFLITLEAAAERLAAEAGLTRADLVPLVRATVENWAALGPERALTGPVARGDEATVARQRAAVAGRAPELLSLFDALVAATRALASEAVAA